MLFERDEHSIERGGDGCTIPEILTKNAQIFSEQKAAIRRCISGLTIYAAGLVANHQEGDIPMLRQFIAEMAEFWNPDDIEGKNGYLIIREKYVGAFNQAVATARTSDQASVLSSQVQENILSGLDLYAQEMANSGGMEHWVRQCDALAEKLREEWGLSEPQMGGMELE